MKLKEIMEKREEHRAAMAAILGTAESENRAMSEQEQADFTQHETELRNLDATARAIRATKDAELDPSTAQRGDGGEGEQHAADGDGEQRAAGGDGEQRAADPIGALVRGDEVRAAEDGITTGSQGPIIPEDLSGDIVRNVRERSAIFGDITIVNSRGVYKQIVSQDMVQGAWMDDELEDIAPSNATYNTIPIGHHTCGALAIISNESINQTAFNVTADVTDQVVETFIDKLEDGIFMGDGTHRPTGLISGGTKFALGAANTITADELVKIKFAIKAVFAAGAAWRMSRKTLESISLLKDANGQYLFKDGSLADDFAGTILGKPVKISEYIPDYTIFFGDYRRAYKANLNPDMTVKILQERFAEKNAVGVIGVMYADGKPINNEAYVVAKYTAPSNGGNGSGGGV
jgi:HK97 family phage major capsid protein